jgi:2,4-dienoyl-CoA reductase (NADPH2)
VASVSPGHRRYPHLFAPLALGPVTIKNRATMAAHGMRLGDHTGTISPRHRAYLVARARGGASVVSASSLPVHETSQRFAGLQIRVSSDALICQRRSKKASAGRSKNASRLTA